jgi:hypothetical protein
LCSPSVMGRTGATRASRVDRPYADRMHVFEIPASGTFGIP